MIIEATFLVVADKQSVETGLKRFGDSDTKAIKV